MREYTVYDEATGQVMYSGMTMHPEHLAAPDGMEVIVGHRLSGGWWDGQAHHAQPEQPSPHHVWDWASKTWSDPRTTQQVEAAATAAERARLLGQIRSLEARQHRPMRDILLAQATGAQADPMDVQAMHDLSTAIGDLRGQLRALEA